MGSVTGFLDTARVENPFRAEAERLKDFEDLHIPQDREKRRAQAARCMNCGVPFCQSDYGCPLHNLIPEWNDLLYRGQEEEALKRLLRTAPFPEFTGHVCPALCEKACNLENDATTNRDNELYLIETGFAKGWIRPRQPAKRTGKRAAVIGSGPSGLAAADLLNQLGHEVTVIEKADRPGGLLMYGIPNMKLPKGIVERRIRLMEAEGIRFRLNTEAIPEELQEYDAVLLCGGARKPRSLNAEHMDARGVMFAVDYLTAATRGVLAGKASEASAAGKHVVVVGGGDTGNDCVGTALRQGCASVTQLEMMPSPPEERTAGNPWPEWPRILRTDYGQAEAAFRQGGDPRVYETTVKEVLSDENSALKAVVTVKVKFEGGKLTEVEGTEQEYPCDLLLIAAGFTGCERYTPEAFGVPLDARGRVKTEAGSYATEIPGIFTAGDMHRGQSLVVWAIHEGRGCARDIDCYLMGYTEMAE